MSGPQRNRHQAAVYAKNNGRCIYCAGLREANTIDHMPPISMFTNRSRPQGLEFPSCVECNHGARRADLVAALVGRVYPDPPDGEDAEAQSLMSAIARHIPGLLPEMRAPRASEKLMMRRLGVTEGGALRLSGPLVDAHLRSFAARLGFAMHFEVTGKMIPPTGGVSVRIYSNVDMMSGDLPQEALAHLPASATLRQGSKNVDDQFQYAVLKTDTRTMSMSFASFRRSFAILAISTENRTRVEAQGVSMFVPGGLAVAPVQSFSLSVAYSSTWRKPLEQTDR